MSSLYVQSNERSIKSAEVCLEQEGEEVDGPNKHKSLTHETGVDVPYELKDLFCHVSC